MRGVWICLSVLISIMDAFLYDMLEPIGVWVGALAWRARIYNHEVLILNFALSDVNPLTLSRRC